MDMYIMYDGAFSYLRPLCLEYSHQPPLIQNDHPYSSRWLNNSQPSCRVLAALRKRWRLLAFVNSLSIERPIRPRLPRLLVLPEGCVSPAMIELGRVRTMSAVVAVVGRVVHLRDVAVLCRWGRVSLTKAARRGLGGTGTLTDHDVGRVDAVVAREAQRVVDEERVARAGLHDAEQLSADAVVVVGPRGEVDFVAAGKRPGSAAERASIHCRACQSKRPLVDEQQQEARESEDALVEVARRAAAIVTHIKQKVQSGAGSLAVSTEMQKILAELHAVMENIRAEVEDVLKIVPFVRFLRRKMVQKKGQTCVQKLDDAWRAFDSALLVHLENQVKAQGESLERLEDQNRSQIPYARFTDIQHKVRQGKYNTSTYSGDQFSGLWGSEQRVVTVRKFDPSLKTCVVRAIRAYSQNQPCSLIVDLTGPRKSIIEDFTGKDPRVWMRKLLQHNVLTFMEQQALVPTYTGSQRRNVHTEGPCLPSAQVDNQGRLVVDASDLTDALPFCVYNCICRLYAEMKSDGDRFTRLGNIDDLAGPSANAFGVSRRVYRELSGRFNRFTWSASAVESHEVNLAPGPDDDHCIGRKLFRVVEPRACNAFFIDHALRLARDHRVDPADIVIDIVRTRPSSIIAGETHLTVAVRVASAWLHILPLGENKQPREPWAYWSFDAEAVDEGQQPPALPEGCKNCFEVAYVPSQIIACC
ncbi:uncharacterized protein BXZ73DRAFT_78938 [Epithele typhae]|uniref:uncharacterized protein n=1 Tax=Epithele typhae TaxID=378194 RepID=UPI002008A85D|nr:uncharacterized protein BXZ73DRAFT_78938 [Epithele typhae]KAH9925597.1 hypothetical protein BXZ73DRAFT_78938 [Epithele typhae]